MYFQFQQMYSCETEGQKCLHRKDEVTNYSTTTLMEKNKQGGR